VLLNLHRLLDLHFRHPLLVEQQQLHPVEARPLLVLALEQAQGQQRKHLSEINEVVVVVVVVVVVEYKVYPCGDKKYCFDVAVCCCSVIMMILTVTFDFLLITKLTLLNKRFLT
jgi:hypothetical protein